MQAVVVTDEADPEAAAAKVLPPKAHKTSLWRWCALALVVAGGVVAVGLVVGDPRARGGGDDDDGGGDAEAYVTGDMTVEGMTLEDARANEAVFVAAVADLADVQEEYVEVAISAARRRRLTDTVTVDYTIAMPTTDMADDLAAAMSSLTTSDVDAAIVASASDAGASSTFAAVACSDLSEPESAAADDGGADAAADDAVAALDAQAATFTATIAVERFGGCDALLESKDASRASSWCPVPAAVDENAPRAIRRVRGGTCGWRGYPVMFGAPELLRSAEDGATADASAGGAADDGFADASAGEAFSGTNAQEEGVDEADTVKATAEGYVFVVGEVRGGEVDSGGAYEDCLHRLSVVRDDGDGVELVAFVDLGPLVTTPEAMFVHGDVLLLYGSAELDYEDEDEEDDAPYWCRGGSEAATVALAFDVSDRENPVLLRRQIFEGRYVTARKVGDFAYLVASKSAWYAAPRASVPFYRDETFDDGFAIDVDDGGSYAEAAGAAGDAVAVCACGDVQYVTAVETALDDFTVVVAVDVSDVAAAKAAPSTKTVLANRAADSAVYCSRENLYLAQTEWTEGDGETYYRTAIVRLALDGADVAYAASYAAPGTLLNQFSLSESALDGTLRVATTSREGSWADTYNNVYVFDESGARLGAVVGLAPGESIKSARFTATRGYLVTFVQTDPLFTISLDDPANPYVMGELKIPGYSAYLHPINASHMLGVGRAADEKTGVERGLQFSLFDVSDELNPRQVAVVEVGDRGSASEALNDHKAFQFWSAGDLRAAGLDRSTGVFALPASLASLSARLELADDDWTATSQWTSGLTYFQGLALYDEMLRPVANVSHHEPGFFDPVYDDAYDYWRTYRNSHDSGAHVTRSLRRGADIFSFSDNHVRKTTLDGALVGEAFLAEDFATDDADRYSYGGWYYGGGHGWYF